MSSKKIQVVLSVDEEARLQKEAKKQSRKMSNMARKFIVDGLIREAGK